MSDKSNAAEYADSLAATIGHLTDAGAPFGWVNSETEEWTDETPDGWTTDPEEGDVNCDYHEASAGDYLSDVLDIEYIVSSDRQFKAARILVAFGGPNAWINTQTGQLEVSWWSAPEYRPLPSAFIEGLDDYLSEMWGDA